MPRLFLLLISLGLVMAASGTQAVDRDLRPPDYNSSLQRVALVIGNGGYQHGKLPNSVNDARAMANMLRELNFDVIEDYDLNQRQMDNVLRRFAGKLAVQSRAGFFYYAGHGAQYENKSYLIPIGADIQFDDQLPRFAIGVDDVLRHMDTDGKRGRVNIVVLDACRNNPFPGRGGGTGLAPAGEGTGTLIAYATSPGKTTPDGLGQHSLYTESLLKTLGIPGLALGDIFMQVRAQVIEASGGRLTPWETSSLVDKFYLRPGQNALPDDPDGVVQRPVGSLFHDALRSGGQGPQMVVLPTGSYRRGDLNGGGDTDEQPVRIVSIGYPIAMMVQEVTFADYDRYVRATDSRKPKDRGWGRETRPVINVSWEDAQGYARWLSQQTGTHYRLPSEAEWEYAARAGTINKTKYHWGNQASHSYANYGIEQCCDGLVEGKDRWEYTAPVRSFPANDWGLYDVHGNVREWVADCYDDSYEGAPVDGRAKENCDTKNRVMRGGSWYDSPADLRSAFRGFSSAFYRFNYVGFRLAQDLNP